jgi:serine protease inhibitor
MQIDKIIQQNEIDVNKKGTKFMSSTYISLISKGIKIPQFNFKSDINFIANRTFMYVLYDSEINLIISLGIYDGK